MCGVLIYIYIIYAHIEPQKPGKKLPAELSKVLVNTLVTLFIPLFSLQQCQDHVVAYFSSHVELTINKSCLNFATVTEQYDCNMMLHVHQVEVCGRGKQFQHLKDVYFLRAKNKHPEGASAKLFIPSTDT